MRGLIWMIAACLLVAAMPPAPAELLVGPAEEEAVPRIVPSGPFHMECWQYGVKIVDRHGMDGLRASAYRIKRWLTLNDATGRESVFAELDDTACLLTPEPKE